MARARRIRWRLTVAAVPSLPPSLTLEARRHDGELLHLHIGGQHLHSGRREGRSIARRADSGATVREGAVVRVACSWQRRRQYPRR